MASSGRRKTVKLKVGRVYRFNAQNAAYASLNLYQTYYNRVARGGVGYKHSSILQSGDTFVVLDITKQGDHLVITSRERSGYIYSGHVNLPFTTWTEVRVPDEEVAEPISETTTESQ